MKVNPIKSKNNSTLLKNLKLPESIITAVDHLIDLPAHQDIFPEDLVAANKKQPKIKNLKTPYPKNGLYGLL